MTPRQPLRQLAGRSLVVALLLLLGSGAARGQAVRELSVLTLNVLWNGAWSEQDVAHVIAATDADLVGMQEYSNPTALLGIARELGYHAFPEGQILSRYPVRQTRTLGQGWSAGMAIVELDAVSGQRVALINNHLSSYPYAPHDLIGGSVDALGAIAQEIAQHVRPELSQAVAAVARSLGRGLPTFVTGDFNSPSHLDWLPEYADLNAGRSVSWPMSRVLEKLGLRDGFRSVHPDRRSKPGYTWSVAPEGISGKHDRIDFVYGGGDAEARGAWVLGEAGGPYTDIAFSPWATDHRGVLVRFDLTHRSELPMLRVVQEGHRANTPIALAVEAPRGASLGPIEVYPVGRFPVQDPPISWIPAEAVKAGRDQEIILGGSSTQGQWPLPAGKYEVFLRSDDGWGSHAASTFSVAAERELVPPWPLRASWSEDAVTLIWKNRATPDHRVRIERRVDHGSWKKLTELAPGVIRYRDDDGVKISRGHVYEYRLVAVDDQGASLPSGSVSASARPLLSVVHGADQPADSVVIRFNRARGGGDDWVGIYAAGKRPETDTRIDWRYVNGTQYEGGKITDGRLTFDHLAPGPYEAFLMCCDGYTPEASVEFEIAEPEPPTLTLDKGQYNHGETIRIRFDRAPGHPEDWIGIYRAEADPATDWYQNWRYANGTRSSGGSQKSGLVQFEESLAPGRYVARFFRRGGYGSIASSPVFGVEK